jgi:hydrogenase/urease accessory protein HupE
MMVGWGASRAGAHQFGFTEAQATFYFDGTFTVDLRTDVDALMLGLPPGSLLPEDYDYLRKLPADEVARRKEGLASYFKRMVRVRFDEEIFEFGVEFPEEGQPPVEEPELFGVLGHTARLTGKVPETAQNFTFAASRVFGPVVLKLNWEGEDPILQPLETGYESDPFPVTKPKPPPTGFEVFRQYTGIGFLHIVPQGIDHILFVLGLFLLAASARPLLWQVTAFTVAHSVTLALSMFNLVRLPAEIVEPLIAISIAFVAVENIFTSELKPWRPAVVFAFGLLHGLGFAGVLADWGLPRGQFVNALIAFNVGVELGQLTVIVGAFLLIGWFYRQPWYRKRIVIPCSITIAAIGAYWAITRIAM